MKIAMKKTLGLLLLLLFAVAALAADQPVPSFPSSLINARFVYVTSYDGGEFNPNILPEDRQAIADVQSALQKWGHFTIVYRLREADMVIAVQRRGNEDVLAVYDPHTPGIYLWRMMGQGGLDHGELPFVSQLQQAYQKAAKR